MGGGILQLICKGAQDVYLTENPEITFFRNIYYKYSNFSFETFKLPLDGNIDFGSDLNCTIQTYGDLLSKIILVIKLNKNTTKSWGYINKLGFGIINQISISINGEMIDLHDSDWLNIYYELNKKFTDNDDFDSLIGNTSDMKKINTDKSEYELYIPINFWFTKHYGSSLPIISLNKNSIEIKIKLNKVDECINYVSSPTSLPTISDCYILANYIYLDDNERTKFKNHKHSYLIQQVQSSKSTISNYLDQYDLKFFHPCKNLIWITKRKKFQSRKKYLSYAFDNDWEEARNNFAKLIWLSTRANLSNNKILCNYDFTIGGFPDLISSGNSILEELSQKVEAELLFYDSDSYANATSANVHLIRNDITFEDMTKTITELKDTNTSTSEQDNYLDNNVLQIYDPFNYSNFINNSDNPVTTSQLKLNGQDRFSTRDSIYFNYLQPFESYKNTPSNGINLYNFNLNPNEFQPSGSCNFSKVDNTKLELLISKNNIDDKGSYFTNEYEEGQLKVYAQNYNLLLIHNGKSGIAYTSQ